MILVCPSCDTRYFAEETAIGKEGRRVRCVSCGHSWFAQSADEGRPPEDTGLTREQVERLRQTAAANSASRNGPHAEYRAKEHARRQRNRVQATGIAWGAGFVIFAMFAGSAVLFRNQVAEAWPRTATLYRMAGLDVNRFGVLLEDVSAKRQFDGTTPVIVVTGTAINPSKERREAPQLRVFLRDDDGKQVESWTASIGVAEIGPGERVAFTSRFTAPPVETYRLMVTFAREDGHEGEAGDPAAHAVEVDGEAGHAQPEAAGHEGEADGAPGKGYEEPGWSGGDGGGAEAHGEEPLAEAAHPPAAQLQAGQDDGGHH